MNKTQQLLTGILIGLTVIVIGLGVYRLGQKSSQSIQTSYSSTSKVKKSAQSQQSITAPAPSSSSATNELWNSSKDAMLEQFMNQWALTMGQSYVKYDGVHPLGPFSDEYPTQSDPGMEYPEAFSGGVYCDSKSQITAMQNKLLDGMSNGNKDIPRINMGWAPNGQGNYEYNVVALYNYKKPYSGRITYAFCIRNGQPVVLVNESTQVGDIWTPTENQDVINNFKSIVQENKIVFHK